MASSPQKRSPRGRAIWTNNGVDHEVFITGSRGKGPDGREFMRIKGSRTGIPLNELKFIAKPSSESKKKVVAPASKDVKPAAPATIKQEQTGSKRDWKHIKIFELSRERWAGIGALIGGLLLVILVIALLQPHSTGSTPPSQPPKVQTASTWTPCVPGKVSLDPHLNGDLISGSVNSSILANGSASDVAHLVVDAVCTDPGDLAAYDKAINGGNPNEADFVVGGAVHNGAQYSSEGVAVYDQVSHWILTATPGKTNTSSTGINVNGSDTVSYQQGTTANTAAVTFTQGSTTVTTKRECGNPVLGTPPSASPTPTPSPMCTSCGCMCTFSPTGGKAEQTQPSQNKPTVGYTPGEAEAVIAAQPVSTNQVTTPLGSNTGSTSTTSAPHDTTSVPAGNTQPTDAGTSNPQNTQATGQTAPPGNPGAPQ